VTVNARKRTLGFTIIEMLVVIAILGILAAVGIPSMTSMIRTSKVRAASSDFYSALLSARSEAVKRRTAVTVAPLGANWTTGWKVTFNAGANTVMSIEAPSSDVAVAMMVGGALTTAVTNIVYGSNGRITSATPTLIFYNATDTTIQARCVGMDPAGMPRTRTDTDNDHADGCN
jgi:type IV fimbrial biogenesis protein FimT